MIQKQKKQLMGLCLALISCSIAWGNEIQCNNLLLTTSSAVVSQKLKDALNEMYRLTTDPQGPVGLRYAEGSAKEFLIVYETLLKIKEDSPEAAELSPLLVRFALPTTQEKSAQNQARFDQFMNSLPENMRTELYPNLKSGWAAQFVRTVGSKLPGTVQIQIMTQILLQKAETGKFHAYAFDEIAESYVQRKDKQTYTTKTIFSPHLYSRGNFLIPLIMASGMNALALKMVQAGAPFDGVLNPELLSKASKGKLSIPFKTEKYPQEDIQVPVLSALDLAAMQNDLVLFKALLEAGAQPMLYLVLPHYSGSRFLSSMGWLAKYSYWNAFRILFEKYGISIKPVYQFSEENTPKSEDTWVEDAATIRVDDVRPFQSISENDRGVLAGQFLEILIQAKSQNQVAVVQEMIKAAKQVNLKDDLGYHELPIYNSIENWAWSNHTPGR